MEFANVCRLACQHEMVINKRAVRELAVTICDRERQVFKKCL